MARNYYPDYLSDPAESQKLADRLNAYWRARGQEINAHVVREGSVTGYGGTLGSVFYSVRSDL